MAAHNRLRAEVLQDLQYFIAAIDRRLPRLLHADEPDIAHDAAELRARALKMIAKLEASPEEADGDDRGQVSGS